MTIEPSSVTEALSDFVEPESGRGIVDKKQVEKVEVDGDSVAVTLGLTTFTAPLWNETARRAEDHLRKKLPGASNIRVDVTSFHRPAEKIGQIGLAAKAVIAVGSGKGGVGKSTMAVNLAQGLQRAGAAVGLMDADVYGPSVPHLLGLDQRPAIEENKIEPIDKEGLKVMSMGFLVPRGEAVIWRGPMLHGAITQFLRDTNWGSLDYLLIDLPPGTGDISLTLSQLLPLTGVVVVCTPQEVALIDAEKAIAMFRQLKIPILGMVENMSGFVCPDCSVKHDIFGTGGARSKAEELEIPLLGEVPINLGMRTAGDKGESEAIYSDPVMGPCFEEITTRLCRQIIEARAEEPPLPSLSVL